MTTIEVLLTMTVISGGTLIGKAHFQFHSGQASISQENADIIKKGDGSEKLERIGYRFVTVSELLAGDCGLAPFKK